MPLPEISMQIQDKLTWIPVKFTKVELNKCSDGPVLKSLQPFFINGTMKTYELRTYETYEHKNCMDLCLGEWSRDMGSN